MDFSWIFGGRENMISFIPKALEERFKDFQEELVVEQEMLKLRLGWIDQVLYKDDKVVHFL